MFAIEVNFESRSALVGRAAELALFERVLAETREGAGHVVLLAGEAGIGKSRLAAAAVDRAQERGYAVLTARCFEQDRALAYAPLNDLPYELSPFSLSFPDPEQTKRRLYLVLTQVMTRELPALVLIEDVQWSDDATLEFLLYVSRHIESKSLLLVLTYRTEEITPMLGTLLTTLVRERHAVEIELERLTADETGEMVRHILSPARTLRADFATALAELTQGNPFFIEEVSKVLAANKESEAQALTRADLEALHIPRTVQLAVQARVQTLSERVREVLNVAAVAGRRFDFALLRAVTSGDERALLDALKELVAAQLVMEEKADAFAFRHALTREAVYTSLLRRERAGLHFQMLGALEELYTHDPLRAESPAEFAYHAYEAGAWTKAFQYAQRAGDKALELYAPRAAVTQFMRAVEAARHLVAAGEDSPDLVPVYRARGHAYEIVGEFEPARQDYLEILDLARNRNARVAEWQALLDLGFLWAAKDANSVGTYLEQALYVARELNEPATLARTLNRVGNWHAVSMQTARATELHTEALGLLSGLADEAGRAETIDLLGVTQLIGGDLVRAAAYYAQAIPLWRALQDPRGLASSLSSLGWCNTGYGGEAAVSPPAVLDASVQYHTEAAALAREIDWRAGEAMALAGMAAVLGRIGEYARALDAAERSAEIATEIEHRQNTTVAHWILGTLYLEMFAPDQAQSYLERALTDADVSTPNWVPLILYRLVSLHIYKNELSKAEALLNSMWTPDLPLCNTGERFVWMARAELALAQGDARTAERTAARLVSEAAGVETYGARAMPRVALLYGEILMARRQKARAAEYLEAAVQGARERGARSLLWRALIARGKLYRTSASSDRAQQVFAEAEALIEQVGATIPEGELRDNFLKDARAQIPRGAHPPVGVLGKRVGGLSAREREIAVRVARGESNREIADELVLSQRTVESHVTNIMTKLGVRSRTQIATWAVENGVI